jgi:hypothetical protein
MRKLFFALLAVLLMAGMAFAVSIPQTEEGKNGPYTWYQPVYNNSGGSLDAGDVVIWDIDSSTGDNDNYVTTTTTAATALVAGVVWPSAISAGDTGTIAIYGMAECDVDVVGVGEMGPLCTSTTAGSGTRCTGTTGGAYAISTEVGYATTQNTCFVKTLGIPE